MTSVCHVAIESDATAAIGMVHWIGLGKVRNFATQDLLAIFHRMAVVALIRFSGCKDSPVLDDVGELQVRELLVENPLNLFFAMDVFHH